MKLNKQDAAAWIAKPPAGRPATLIYGDDAMRVALKRQDLVAAIVGPQGDDEMRLTRLQASDLTSDKSALSDALKAQGFFPGPRAVLVEDATNAHAKIILAALDDWNRGDAHMVVVGRALQKSSALRKGFEARKHVAAIAIYDEPMGMTEIRETLAARGIEKLDRDAEAALQMLAARIDPGDFRQVVEKLSLFKVGDAMPVTSEDVQAVAPASTEADMDEVIAIVADGHSDRIGPVMQRLWSQGTQPVGLCIAAQRHFRTLLTAASDPGGAGAGIGRLRPPVFGPRRDAILRQAQSWGAPKLERAMRLLTETDMTLRSASRAPHMAVLERAFIRLAMMGKR